MCSLNESCGAAHSPGAPLWKILEAGQWRSPAFLKYLDMNSLDTELVAQAHCDESDSDDEDSMRL